MDWVLNGCAGGCRELGGGRGDVPARRRDREGGLLPWRARQERDGAACLGGQLQAARAGEGQASAVRYDDDARRACAAAEGDIDRPQTLGFIPCVNQNRSSQQARRCLQSKP